MKKRNANPWSGMGTTLGVWILVLVTTPYFVSYLGVEKLGFLKSQLASLFILIYALSFLLIKHVTEKKLSRPIAGVLFSLLFLAVFYYPGFRSGEMSVIAGLYGVLYAFVITYVSALSYMAFDWKRKAEREQELEKQNLQSELTILKNQINPHFLFNTLNNIDSLIKSNPDRASESLIELSDMMRYMIYQTNEERVSLKQELSYIDNFLELQKLQYANPDLVRYTITGEGGRITQIAPMIFLAFIENAFKHCNNKEKKHAIDISFDITDMIVSFKVVNIVDKSIEISKDKSSGVGLDIVRRRLELIYPKRHELTIEEKDNLFSVTLKIDAHDPMHCRR